jgi:hypothetical protein
MWRTLAAAMVVMTMVACDNQPVPTAPDLDATAFAKGSGGNDGRMEIALSGSPAFPEADGKSKYRDRGGEQQLEIELEDGPANTAVQFWVDGNLLGAGTTNGFGDVELRLNSDEGDAVPAVSNGTTVAVTTTGGTTIVSGAF